jgi:hypothetical protein
MRTSCVKNGLVVAVILLFIGVGAYPTIAINSENYSPSVVFEKDNPTTEYEEIYENSNCFVIGRTTNTFKFLSTPFNKNICFGWIYIKGTQVE